MGITADSGRHRRRRRLAIGLVALAAVAAGACGTRVDDSESAGTGGNGSAAAGRSGSSGAGSSSGSATSVVGSGDAGAGGASGGAATGAGGGGSGTAGGGGGSGGGSDGGGGAFGGEPIVIGAVGTRGGLIGDNGAGAWASLEAWHADVNARGGINGREVQLVTADDGADPGRHVAAVRRLVQENRVVAFVGNFAPLTFSAGIPVLEEFGVPSIGGDSGEHGYFETPMSFAFNGAALPEGRTAGKWAPGHFADKTKLAIFYIAEIEFGNTVARELRDGWQAAGKEVVVFAAVSLGQPDYTAEILRARSAGAEVVTMYADFSGCRRMFDAARRQNFKPAWLTASACYHAGAADAADQTANNLWTSIPMEPPSSDAPEIQNMLRAMATYKPDFPNPEANGVLIRGWASGRLFERVLEVNGGRAGSQELIDTLHTMEGETIYGLVYPMNWPPGPHPERPCGKMLGFDGARWYVATPEYIC